MLDVVRDVKIYLKMSMAIMQSDSLFVLLVGSRKGQVATKSTIYWCIIQLIAQT